MSELFIIATQKHFRFGTIRGLATTEDLWDMPLIGDFSLNKVAQNLSQQIKDLGEENFVATKIKKDKILAQKLEVVKFIIAEKLAAQKELTEAAEQKLIRDKARKILADRADSAFTELSDKELKKLAK